MNPSNKPGLYTTEFWLAIVANVIALLVLFRLIPVESQQAAVEAATHIIIGVNSVYALSRGAAKALAVNSANQ